MKKKYIIPEVQIVAIEVEHLIADSYAVNNEVTVSGNKGGWVKRDRSSYSVWDDDWQNP